MLRGIHNKLGSAGLIVAVCAVVLAVGGTALAASGALSGKQKKEVEKIAKKFAGKPGPAGTNGTNGKDGTNGTPGTDGKSVTVTQIAAGAEECEERGGALVKQEGATSGAEVCSGAEGSPWTAGGTLPEGATETGTFTTIVSEGASLGAVSFTIPLATPLSEASVHAIEYGASAPAECDNGKAPAPSAANPEADPGNLCVFLEGEAEALILKPATPPAARLEEPGAGRTGAQVLVLDTTSGGGTWAVTAPTP